ncbi:MAG: phage integrase SAM-like domain-containing protein [Saprospiraceae bacterium]|nr:phage integrase SAM-like domain-containing protein [Saprospiraceae bacterium]
MTKDFAISLYLDTRRTKSSGKYPVKLRVFTPSPRIQKLYSTVFELSKKDFESIWNTSKPRIENKELRSQMQAVELKACKVAEKLTPFTFDQFEKQLFRKAGDGIKVKYHFERAICEFTKRKQIGTASTYDLSEKSITEFLEKSLRRSYDKLSLLDITPSWLLDYEAYMTDKGRSLTTISMYLRALRALFNNAISEKEIEKAYYPFGKRKYQVPATKNVKKALSKVQLRRLFGTKAQTPEQQKAKDFWFFSYACNGINIKDIALLKWKDIKEGRIEFYRAKTRITSKGNLKLVTAYLNEFSMGVIEKYGNPDKEADSPVFEILENGLTPKEEQSRVKNFTRFINQHIKNLSIANDLPGQISTYWARHSFATNSVRNGASMEFIQESLGHENISTTQNYFAGFDDEAKKEFADSLMNFD